MLRHSTYRREDVAHSARFVWVDSCASRLLPETADDEPGVERGQRRSCQGMPGTTALNARTDQGARRHTRS